MARRKDSSNASPTPEQLQRGKDFATWLNAAVSRAGLNPNTLSQKINKSAAYLYYLSNNGLDTAGTYRRPSEELINAIADATRTSASDGRRAAGYDPGDLPNVQEGLSTLPQGIQSAVVDFIEKLKQSGQLTGLGDSVMVPIIGTVSAGLPPFSGGSIEEQLPLPRHMVSKFDESSYFAIRVKGDSLSGLHIVDCDLLLCHRADTAPHSGDIVAVVTDSGEVVARRFRENPQTGRRWLETVPLTGTLEIIEITDDSRILGIKVGLYREG